MRPVVLAVLGIVLVADLALAAGGAPETATSPSRVPRTRVPDVAPDASPIGDARQVLALAASDRDQLTEEMRAMLEGTQKIVQGIADNDMKVVAKVARSLGAGMAGKVEDSHAHHLPPEFEQLGNATHADFDRIAVIAERGGGAKQAAAQLGATLNRCVACHSTWRVQVVPPPGNAPASAHPEH